MACSLREQTGRCSHYQCQFSTKTEHGFECIELAGGFCECGEGCLKKCPYSWRKNTVRAKQVDAAFARKYSGEW